MSTVLVVLTPGFMLYLHHIFTDAGSRSGKRSSLAGAAGLFVTAAQAGPLANSTPRIESNVLTVQHEPRREHHEDRAHDRPAVVIQQDRHHEPRREHHEDRPQQHGQPGVAIQVPGVSVGVGTSHERR